MATQTADAPTHPTPGSTASTESARPTPEPAELRAVLGRFATGVTVITSADADGPVGFACQSFASVSLEPPLVLFCADHRGRAWPRIRETGRFTVNILAADQAELCGRFGSRHGRKFDGLEWDASCSATPSLRGVLARVHADVETVHTSGDHDVVLGRVHTLEPCRDASPMLFYRGRFDLDDNPDPGPQPVPWEWGWTGG